jgi:glycosyltransferase involved in cell wall biosynthesis
MKIGFSARGLSIPSGGVRQYIESILPALAGQIDKDELFVFYNDEKFCGLAPNCSEILIKGNNKIIWDLILLPQMLKKLGIDAVIFPKNVVPFNATYHCFAVIHDLAYFDKKLNAYPLLDTIYMRMMIPRSVLQATHIFAVSESTKKDIIHYTKCSPKKLTVTYEAADEIYRPIQNQETLNTVRSKFNLPDRFILYAGSLSPRKNIITLLRAFAAISNKIPHNLVLTASKSWKDKQVYKTINQLKLTTRINKLGYVSAEDMPSLYNIADVFVYPSLYEGFGLPVLEAMQCGCPVVASNVTSIPEVAGNAALLIDPFDVNALAEAIFVTLTDSNVREKLISSGFKQAGKFSWNLCAQKMLDTIKNTLAINSTGSPS